jgi:hypothetical protein
MPNLFQLNKKLKCYLIKGEAGRPRARQQPSPPNSPMSLTFSASAPSSPHSLGGGSFLQPPAEPLASSKARRRLCQISYRSSTSDHAPLPVLFSANFASIPRCAQFCFQRLITVRAILPLHACMSKSLEAGSLLFGFLAADSARSSAICKTI